MLLQTYGLKHCNVTIAAIIMILEPVWTLLLSMLILEPLTLNKALGGLLIVTAILIYRVGGRNRG